MARKSIIEIPKEATFEAVEVVESISTYSPNYILGVPEEFRNKNIS